MPRYLVTRTEADVKEVLDRGDHLDSWKAAWFAIKRGGEVIRDLQRVAPQHRKWVALRDAEPFVNEHGRLLLKMRIESIERLKRAPHHARGFRLSAYTGAKNCRPVNSLCLISGHAGQEIPGLVAFERVVVDAEHMEQALGPATVTEILNIRKAIGEHVYISTNVSESPQLVRTASGTVDSRATAALTASKVLAAIEAGTDVVKVGFAHLDIYKRDLRSDEVVRQLRLVRQYVDDAVEGKAIVMPLNRTRRYPLISVFFPEIGIDSNGERPIEIAEKGIELAARGGWQGVLIDTYEKHTGKAYRDFYTLDETARLAAMAHSRSLELWIAGSIPRPEVAGLLKCRVDLICFGGAARHSSGARTERGKGR
jgi:uncharacterized protein (UPF0264 family)